MVSRLLSSFPFAQLQSTYKKEPSAILHKDGFDFATDADLTAESILIQWIQEHFPNEAILSEETLSETSLMNEALWIVDPLDGTYNFSLNLPYYGLQIARQIKGKTIFSLIWLPQLNVMIVCEHGKCQWLELNELHQIVPYSKHKKTHGTQSVSFGDFSKSNPDSIPFQALLMSACAKDFNKIRINGASSVDFTLLCLGAVDAHVLFSKRPWELIPGLACANALGLKHLVYNCSNTYYSGPCHIIGKEEAISKIVAHCNLLL